MTKTHPRPRGKTLMILAGIFFLQANAVGVTAQERSSSPKTPGPGTHTFSLPANGLERSYLVHVPARPTPQKGFPVVIMFHGGGGTARAAMRETGWADKADGEGFLAVFPEGTRADPSRPGSFSTNPQNWNDGSDRQNVGAVKRKAADVDFVRALIADLRIRFLVDPHRIYATGFSNGASMTFRVGRKLSRTLAAIAPVAGNDWSKEATIERPLPVLYITGTADPLNPIEGGTIRIGSRVFGTKPPVQELIVKWVQLLGCPTEPLVVHDQNGVRAMAYGPGRDRSEVVFYTVEEMGHTWPGGQSLLPERLVGKTSDKISATDVIWRFFQTHPRK